jgi:hypothetical protein
MSEDEHIYQIIDISTVVYTFIVSLLCIKQIGVAVLFESYVQKVLCLNLFQLRGYLN